MGDVICARCGEPWEYYYVMHEMGEFTKSQLLGGFRCPCCKGKHDSELPGKHSEEWMRSLADETDLNPIEYMGLNK